MRSSEEERVVKHHSDFELYSMSGSQHISGKECPKRFKVVTSGFHTGAPTYWVIELYHCCILTHGARQPTTSMHLPAHCVVQMSKSTITMSFLSLGIPVQG